MSVNFSNSSGDTNDAPLDGLFVVTVTYGNRRELLDQMVASVVLEGVRNIVVVDNGASWDTSQLSGSQPGTTFHVVRMGRNVGSAAGFTAGMSAAILAGANTVWLLDDDNRPRGGALGLLGHAYMRELAFQKRRDTAVLAFRPDHQPQILRGGSMVKKSRRSSFLGFHLLDVPGKMWVRLKGCSALAAPLPEIISMDAAPYSGLLLHREAIEASGMPRDDFVLYMDDTEWSSRIVHRGGRIALVTGACVDDLEASWNVTAKPTSRITSLVCGEGDFRAYYSTRNAAYLSTNDPLSSPIVRKLNRWVYMILLWIVAVLKRRTQRFALLLQAVRDGENGRLGENPEYPL